MIIIALPDKAGFSKAMLVRHWTGRSSRQGKLTMSIDGSDPRGYALVRSGQRARHCLDRRSSVNRLTRDTLDGEASEHTRHSDHIAIDGSSCVTAFSRSALLSTGWHHDVAALRRQLSRRGRATLRAGAGRLIVFDERHRDRALPRVAHRRHHAGCSADASRAPPSSAEPPSPTCCAICSRADFPIPMEVNREGRSQHRLCTPP